MISGRTIFISPIDWGLGHATRCVPIIEELSKSNTILIGVTNVNATFFEKHFPDLQKIELPSYKISYSKILPLWLKLALQWPRINGVMKQEKELLQEIISKYKINLVISDNRYGLNTKSVECIFITHQLSLKAPFFSGLANKINKKYIHQFNQVWVPDYEESDLRLSGQLSDSHHIKIPVKYIGPKSALMNASANENTEDAYDYLILLSGVEPQRSILEKKILQKFVNSDKKIVLVRGSDLQLKYEGKNVKIINFSYGHDLAHLIVSSETVICRSGYSTLMDLHVLGKKKVLLIPTPGQTEQEYLADYWEKKFKAEKLTQGRIKHEF